MFHWRIKYCFKMNILWLQSAGMQAIDEIVPTLLSALEDDETSDTALDGLKQILRFLFFYELSIIICCLFI